MQGGAWRWSVNGPVTGLRDAARARRVRARPQHDDGGVRDRADFDSTPPPAAPEPTFAMAAPWPLLNPSRGAVTFAFTLPAGGDVRVEILDVSGRRVRTLQGRALAAGRHVFAFDGRSRSGSPCRRGSYFARALYGRQTLTRAFVLAR